MLCELCQSEEVFNFHHFIPRTLHSNKWFKKRFTRQQMQRGLQICKTCHATIHDLVPDEKELGRHYHSRELLLAHPQIQNYVRWQQKRHGVAVGEA